MRWDAQPPPSLTICLLVSVWYTDNAVTLPPLTPPRLHSYTCTHMYSTKFPSLEVMQLTFLHDDSRGVWRCGTEEWERGIVFNFRTHHRRLQTCLPGPWRRSRSASPALPPLIGASPRRRRRWLDGWGQAEPDCSSGAWELKVRTNYREKHVCMRTSVTTYGRC